jgi:cytochrome c-type biogenesis protein CcmH
LQQVQALIGKLEQRNPDLVPAAGVIQTINLEVDITPELKNRANPNDTVFVYAKAAQGPPMPLAVKKLKLSDLPATVVLSDNDAMIPSMKLSSFDQLILGARVSRSGKPVPQPGDFFTEINALDRDPSTQRIALQIDRVK